jgi:hypothetical protein
VRAHWQSSLVSHIFKKIPSHRRYNAFSAYGECTASCGSGTKSAFRGILVSPEFGGAECEGGPVDTKSCGNLNHLGNLNFFNTKSCSNLRRDGVCNNLISSIICRHK